MEISSILAPLYGVSTQNNSQQGSGSGTASVAETALAHGTTVTGNSTNLMLDSASLNMLYGVESGSGGSGLTSLLTGGSSGSSDPTVGLLSAYYGLSGPDPLMLANLDNLTNPSSDPLTSVTLEGGVSMDFAQGVELGIYTMSYDSASRTFALQDPSGDVATAVYTHGNSVDFGNGVTLSLSDAFDPHAPLAPEAVEVYAAS